MPNESEETEVKKDLNWFKEQLDDIEMNTPRLWSHNSIWMLDRVNELLNQIDEPEVLSQECIEQKSIDTHVDTLNGEVQFTFELEDLENLIVPKQELPVIPKFVADWIEEAKGRHHSLYEAMADYCSPEMNQWIQDFYHSDLFARAWLDGYEVAEEQKYYVINNDQRMMLVRKMDGKTITEADPFKLEDMYEVEKKSHRLTEQEIKDYDERYFSFAVKVKEMEE